MGQLTPTLEVYFEIPTMRFKMSIESAQINLSQDTRSPF